MALVLVALSVGLSNFAAAVAMGISGVDAAFRIRVVLVFTVFEAVMPVIGLAVGHDVAGPLGGSANTVGGVVLGVAGAYGVLGGLRQLLSSRDNRAGGGEPDRSRSGHVNDDASRHDTATVRSASSMTRSTPRLLIGGLVLSIDNLVVGFGLGARRPNIAVAMLAIATTTIALTVAGLELGRAVGERVGAGAEVVGGLVLAAVGIAVGTGVL